MTRQGISGPEELPMGIIAAIALFAALVAGISLFDARTSESLEAHDQPKRSPRPGARDVYTVTGALAQAPVPRWG
ncbi:MAG: hypothetical protein JWN41_1192 [Thermoleophilia bacterium]|nr:hypothetical protein [Thermoleophilia bacterium]